MTDARFARIVALVMVPVAVLIAVVVLFGLAPWLDERNRLFREQAQQGVDALLAEFPFESLEDRLPRPPEVGGPLREAAAKYLADLEEFLDRDAFVGGRVGALKRLHEETEKVFAISPGFGPERGIRFTDVLRRKPFPLWRPGMENDAPTSGFLNDHTRTVASFAPPTDAGYVKSRQLVAGFRPHHFWEPPEVTPRWSLRSLDLVGLIVHEKPTAYVFDGLPTMTEVSKVPTRPLDEFEAGGLAELRQGEILVVRDVPDGLRVLGAIRAAKQCVECHGGERGDLLGAFSYTLTSRPK
jgi:hypothetical protein